MEDELNFEPTPKQADFVVNTAKFSCMSGGFGSGKTVSGCLRALLLSKHPKNRGLIGRSTYVELRNTTRKSFFELCPPSWYDESLGGQWKPSENLLRLTNGSEILFMHLDTVSEKELLSLNIGWFYIDQAEEISEKVFQILTSRLRLNTVPNTYGFITCNPEPGSWIYEKFKKPYEENKPHPDYFLVDTSSYDNPYLPKDYIATMKAQYPEEMAKRYIEGRWDVFEGQILPEFDRNIHVIKPFEIPKSWEFVVSLDHGMVNPTAALLAAIDYDGNIFIIDEYYSPGMVSEHAEGVKAMAEDYDISMWLIDPSTKARTREKNGMPWSVIEEYEDYGLYFIPANNEKLAGINRVKEFLKIDEKRINPITHEKKSPRIFIFQNCASLLWEIPQYQWRKLRSLSQRNAPEQARDFNDHAVDALRYLIMSRFPPPMIKATGYEMISPWQRSNMNDMTKPVPNIKGDPVLGQYGEGSPIGSPLASDVNYE